MLKRRDILKLGSAGAVALISPGAALAQTPPPSPLASLADGQTFRFEALQAAAKALSQKPYQAVSAPLPDVLGANMSINDFRAIRLKREFYVWNGDPAGFSIEPLHRGFVFGAPVTLFTIEDGTIRRVTYEASRFNFGKLTVPEIKTDIGFSGFRIHLADVPNLPDMAIFQGASFFQARARGQNYGMLARALAIRTAEPRGEEFPFFRAFWIEKPAAGSGMIIVNALADCESASAAFRFTLRPGDATIIDTEATLYARAAIDHVGFSPMQGTYMFGPNSRRTVDDIRPSVHECDGLQMYNGRGEWLWRPVQNPDSLQVSAFVDENPRGFGLMQRDRDPNSYYDSEQRWETRPSLWIEPIGDWGQGTVQLVEIPSDSDVNDNIIGYWRPRGTVPAGREVSIAYRQFWCWALPEKIDLATVTTTRIGRASSRARRILVEFSGDQIGALKQAGDVKVNLSAAPGSMTNIRNYLDAGRKTFRVVYEFEPGGETTSEMRLQLEIGGKPISETWLYRWTA